MPVPRLNLADWRAQTGVSIEQIEAETKITRRFLRAIEEERFDELPGGVFTLSYLKQYASAIGFDEAELLACYSARQAEAGDPVRKAPQEETLGSRLGRWAFSSKVF